MMQSIVFYERCIVGSSVCLFIWSWLVCLWLLNFYETMKGGEEMWRWRWRNCWNVEINYLDWLICCQYVLYVDCVWWMRNWFVMAILLVVSLSVLFVFLILLLEEQVIDLDRSTIEQKFASVIDFNREETWRIYHKNWWKRLGVNLTSELKWSYWF